MTDAGLDHTHVAGEDDPMLVLPHGWVVDDVTRERMARQLARVPEHVVGVVAETGELPSGASYRVHAERLAMQPLSAVTEIPENTASDPTVARGAALLRAGVSYELEDGLVRIKRGSFLVDHGCHAHDPWRPVELLRTATELGRPPFSWRPLVVILGTERDPDDEDWARRLANSLLRRDVEGRVAVPEVTGGLHLTRPCRPDAESIAALAPDVIIALDNGALDLAAAWCAQNRSTVLVATTPDIGDSIDLVSWRIGNASGRLRARVGHGVGAPAVAALVNRLCAGPHPAPPRDEDVVGTEPGPAPPAKPASTVPRAHSIVVVAGVLDAASRARIDGIADHAGATSGTLRVVSVDETASTAVRGADLVIIRAVSPSDALTAIIDERQRDGRTTVVDIGLSDVRFPGGEDGPATLTPPAEQLAAATGLAVTASSAIRATLHARGVRAHQMPTLITRARAAELRSLREARGKLATPVVGWHVGASRADRPEQHDRLAGALVDALAGYPELELELVGDAALMPETLLRHRRVRVMAGDPAAETLAGWSVQLWTPDAAAADVSGDLRPVVEAAYVGVPTLVSSTNPAVAQGLVPGALIVEGELTQTGESSVWMPRLNRLLADGRRLAPLAQQVTRRIEALYNTPASAAVIARFVGWAYNRVGAL